MKRYIYLISPKKIRPAVFYKDLAKVVKNRKVKYFQLRLKKISKQSLLKISKKIKKITKKNNVKFLINDTNFLMSFSYGRALQQSALKNWGKNIKDIEITQKIFNHRSKMNGLSTAAKWNIDLEKQLTV